MKFMQRGAAAPPSTPASDEPNAAKRRKVSEVDSASSPAALFDRAAIQAALDDEERKRQAAIERQAAELGDSRWVLDLTGHDAQRSAEAQPSFNVVPVGFGEIDEAGVGEDGGPSESQRFRRFNMKRPRVCPCHLPPSSNTHSDIAPELRFAGLKWATKLRQ
jgi:hypothetical protein